MARNDSGDFSALGKDGAPLYRLVAAGASRKARCRLAFAEQVSTGMPFAIADERDHGGPYPDKGKPSERVGRKATGLSLERDKVAGPPVGCTDLPRIVRVSVSVCVPRRSAECIEPHHLSS